MIYGLGTDIQSIEEIRTAIERHPRFADRHYTEDEVKYCNNSPEKLKWKRYTTRWAVKEAFIKAFGKFPYNEIGVVNENNGKPSIVLYGKTKEEFEKKNLEAIVSISHGDKDVVATVIIDNCPMRKKKSCCKCDK